MHIYAQRRHSHTYTQTHTHTHRTSVACLAPQGSGGLRPKAMEREHTYRPTYTYCTVSYKHVYTCTERRCEDMIALAITRFTFVIHSWASRFLRIEFGQLSLTSRRASDHVAAEMPRQQRYNAWGLARACRGHARSQQIILPAKFAKDANEVDF